MMKMKKIVAIVMTIGMVGMIVPSSAQAVTVEELQAQIATLLAQIATLQTQLTAMGGTTGAAAPAACSGVTFDRNLKLGMTGTDVQCMQALLNQSSDTQVAASGAGSPGAETTYFGSLTQAAVIKFQEKYASEVLASYGLTSGTGFVGSTTRAKLTSLLTAGTTGGTTGGETGGTTTPTLPTAEGLTVTLASDNPVATTIISDGETANVAGSQALIPFLKLTFSTPAGTSAKVTTLKVKRIGISTDTDTPSVYLYEGDTKLAEMTSLSLGVVSFTNAAGLFTVSGVKTITVKADLYKDATAGKTIGFTVNAATDITTDASTVNGTFPMNGNVMTTAVVSDFGRLQVTTSSNSATVDPGTDGFEAMRIILTSSNQKILVKSIKFLQLGSIQKSDIANLALYVGATQLGSTVASLADDGTVTFDLGSYEVPSGVQRIVSLKVDVIGGSTRTIQFSLQRSTDVVAMDGNYGVYVQPDGGTVALWTVKDSTASLVAQGNLVITRSTDSPSGNVALNSTNITLAKFDVKAVGEAVRISSLSLIASSTTAVVGWDNITNVRLIYDGIQVGTTQNTLATTVAATPVNLTFTAPVGVTKTLEIKADIRSSATAVTALANGATIKMILGVGTSNAQRMTSLGSFGFPGTALGGNEVTVVIALLSAAKNSTIGNISAVYNQSAVTIASYLVTAGAAEGVDISKFIFEDATSSTATAAGTNNLGAAFSNLTLWYGSTQLGSTIVPNSSAPAATYEFNPSTALSLAAGQTIRVDLKADVISGAVWANGNATKLSSIESTGKVTTNAANLTYEVAGQALALSGAGTLSAATDPSTPDAAIVAMGDTEKVMGIWKLSANTIEPLTASKIMVFNNGTANSVANVKNLKLYCGSAQFGAAAEGLLPAVTGYGWYTPYAVFGGACVVPKGGNTIITLKADITTYGDGAQAGQYAEFYITVPAAITGATTDTILARGAGDNATVSGTAASSSVNRVYPYRTSLTSALACSGSCTGRTRSATDKVAVLTLTGTNSADAKLIAAVNGEDDAALDQWVIAPAGATATEILALSATNTDAVNKLDGAASVKYTASTSNPATGVNTTTTYAAVDMGTSLVGYSKLSLMWRVDTVANVKAATLFVGWKATSTWADRIASSSVATSTMVADKWFTAEMDLTGLVATNTYVGLAVAMSQNTVLNVLIDAVKVYNDSITVNVSGNATDTNRGTAFYLKTVGGSEKAVGYYDYLNSRVILVPSSEIAIGATPVPLDMITDTTKVIDAAVSGISRTLTLSINLGSVDTAGTLTPGDFRWNDQAIAATTPITWMNGASPISVTLSLASGN